MLLKESAYHTLKKRIAERFYPAGSKLPSEQRLAAELKISRVTLRAALARLQQENLIEKNGRSGNYISSFTAPQRFIYLTFSNNLEELGIVDNYLVSELQNALTQYNHSLILFPVQRLENLDNSSLEELLRQNDISGIFLHSPDFNQAPTLLDMIRNIRIPVVEFGNKLSPDGSFASVCTDIRQAFSDGVRYLATLGYKRIATIFKKNSMRGFTRNTYEDFLQSCDLDESIPLIFDQGILQGNKLPELMKSSNPPQAFMCFCDCTAARVITQLQQQNIKIPEEVAVMGISGYVERLFITPPLSVINFHYDRMAEEAANLMLNHAKWFLKEPAVIRYISHEIVLRGTTPALINNNK